MALLYIIFIINTLSAKLVSQISSRWQEKLDRCSFSSFFFALQIMIIMIIIMMVIFTIEKKMLSFKLNS